MSVPAASSSSAPAKPTAIIIGGGIAGCALALFLQRAGIESTVFEAYAKFAEVPGGLGLACNGMNVLKTLGLDGKLAAQSSPTKTFRFSNHEGAVMGELPMGGVARYGVDGVACTRLALHRVLHDAMVDRGLKIHYKRKLKELSEASDCITATFEDGSSVTGSFVVGADGVHSRVRNILFPKGPQPEYIGLCGFGGAIPVKDLTPEQLAQLPPEGCMDFIFGDLGFMGASRFGLDEKTGEEMMGWWSNAPEEKAYTRAELQSMTQADVRERLLGLHGHWRAPLPELIRRGCADDAPMPITKLQIYDLQDLPQWSKGRALLVGDAAHCMSPNSGQGAAQALEDVCLLAVLLHQRLAALTESNLTSDYSAIFGRFQAMRKPRVDKINRAARARGDDKKKAQGPWARWVRDLGMKVFFWFMQGKFNDEEFGYRVPGAEVLSGENASAHAQTQQQEASANAAQLQAESKQPEAVAVQA